MMRLTGQKIFDATQVLATIINEKRPLPTKGIYRVTRMHGVLFVEFNLLNEQRTAKIVSYGYKQAVLTPFGETTGTIVPSTTENLANPDVVQQDAVPDDKMPEFIDWWKELASVEVDVNIEPIPLDQLSLADDVAGSISYAEFAVLGDLVAG